MHHLLALTFDTATTDTPYTIMLAALNVLQTIALAFLAMKAHKT